jgi:hypothetical protein
LLALYGLVLLALAVVLVLRFRATRNVGYVVLGVALPLWPLVSWPLRTFLHSQVDRFMDGEGMLFPLSLLADTTTAGTILRTFSYTLGILQVSLILVGFLLLARPSARDAPAAASPEPEPAGSAEEHSG